MDTLFEYHDTDRLLLLVAEFLGYISTFCFTFQYAPQAYLNYQRKSVQGLSPASICIKLIGASFFAANTLILVEALPLCIYAFFNMLQHLFFMIQFAIYTKNPRYYGFFGIPVIAYALGIFFPETIPLTGLLKPASQLISHLPQLYLCYQKGTTDGISLATQHLNIMGSLCGLLMYCVVEAKSSSTYLVYWSSFFQAFSIYAATVYFDGWEKLRDSIPLMKKHPRELLPTKSNEVSHMRSPIPSPTLS